MMSFQYLLCFLQKEMATHSSTPAWKIPWMEEPCILQSMELDVTERLHFHFFFKSKLNRRLYSSLTPCSLSYATVTGQPSAGLAAHSFCPPSPQALPHLVTGQAPNPTPGFCQYCWGPMTTVGDSPS